MSTANPVVESPPSRRPQSEKPGLDVKPCNFRYAGRLSNENASALSSLFERFSANASNALEAYLGAALRLKLGSIEQSTIQDHLAAIALDSYLVPCTLSLMQTSLLTEMDLSLALPIIDLLLGGVGTPLVDLRELTDIDEEILRSVSALFLKEIEALWSSLSLSYRLRSCIRPASVPALFATNEKVVILLFEMEIAGATGCFRIVLPTSFVGYLIRHLNASQAARLSGRQEDHRPTLSQRIVSCRFTLSADVTQMRVMVRDLIALEPGQVIKMRAPIANVGRLTVEGVEVFRAMPVRSGLQKAAQVQLPSTDSSSND